LPDFGIISDIQSYCPQ